ncbi:MAG TPA: hypothetical protein VKP11_00960 [Frankiaceae bacterium]|nr:hypothetical protein [Frankiaceae bacterium]
MTRPTARALTRLAGLGAAAAVVCALAGIGGGTLLAFLLGTATAAAVGALGPACTCARRTLRCPRCLLPVGSGGAPAGRTPARSPVGRGAPPEDRCDQGLHDVDVPTDGGLSCACGQVRAPAER